MSQEKKEVNLTSSTMRVFIMLLVIGITKVVLSEEDTIDSYEDSDVEWDTTYDKKFTFSCPRNQFLSRIRSQHNNWKQDRRFAFRCQNMTDNAKLESCKWKAWANELDQPMSFECTEDEVIAGLYSEHDNTKEDRRYRFMCCKPNGFRFANNSCEYTDYINNWDRPFDYRVPRARFIAGVMSEHNNRYEDRRFRFRLCNLAKMRGETTQG